MGAGLDGSVAGERCLQSIVSFGLLGCFSGRAKTGDVLEGDVGNEWRQGFSPERWQMLMSGKAEVNQPLLIPLFLEVDQGDCKHVAVTHYFFFSSSVKQGIDC